MVAENPYRWDARQARRRRHTRTDRQARSRPTFADTPQVPFEELRTGIVRRPARLGRHPAGMRRLLDQRHVHAMVEAPVQRSPNPNRRSDHRPAPDGAPCSPAHRRSPRRSQAGSTSSQAGAFTAFTLQITHPDGDQALQGMTVHLPPATRRCSPRSRPAPNPRPPPEQCGPESEIGQATASAGLGPDPYTETGQRLHHRPLRRCAVRPVDRDPRRRRPIRPRPRRRALHDQRRPAHRCGDDRQHATHDRPGHRHAPSGVPAATPADHRARRPARLRVQPHQLRTEEIEGTLTGAQGSNTGHLRAIPGRQLPEPPLPPLLHSRHEGQQQQSQRRRPHRQDRLHTRPGQHRQSPGRSCPRHCPHASPRSRKPVWTTSSKPTPRPARKAHSSAPRRCTRRSCEAR